MAGPREHAAILCPGPGLAAALPRLRAGELGPFDLTIGVNRAAKAYPCDYWSILDAKSYADIEPIGSPMMIMCEREWRALTRQRPAAATRHGVLLREDLPTPPRSTRWYRYTATVAVVAAWGLGAGEIVVFGADLAGRADWDGQRLDRQVRDDRRWSRERHVWLLMAAWFKCQGINVIRRQCPAKDDSHD